MYYSVYNVAINAIRTDFAYWHDKDELKQAFEKHLIKVEKATKNNIHEIWKNSYKVIETPLITLKDKDKHNIKAYFNGEIKNVQVGWFDDLIDIMDWKRDIEYIIEIKEFGFASAWYIVFRINEKPLVIKHSKGYDNNTYFAMNSYRIRLGHKIYAMTENDLLRLTNK